MSPLIYPRDWVECQCTERMSFQNWRYSNSWHSKRNSSLLKKSSYCTESKCRFVVVAKVSFWNTASSLSSAAKPFWSSGADDRDPVTLHCPRTRENTLLLFLPTVYRHIACFLHILASVQSFERLSLYLFLGLPVLLRPVGNLIPIIFTVLSSVIQSICSFHFFFLSSTQSLILSILHVCLMFLLFPLYISVFPLFFELFSSL